MTIAENDGDVPMFQRDRMIAPPEVKLYHAKWWWGMSLLFLIVGILQLCAWDMANGINSLIMSFFMYYLVREDCTKMSQCCVYFSCVMNFTYVVLGLIGLYDVVRHGRVTLRDREQDPTTGTVTIREERHNFYEPSQGEFYMFQSAMLVVGVIPNFFATLVAMRTYNVFPKPLFSPAEGETFAPGRPDGYSNQGSYGGYYSGGGGAPGSGGGTSGGSGGGGAYYGGSRQPTALFQGSGQQLGRS